MSEEVNKEEEKAPEMGDVHKISETYKGNPIDGQHPVSKVDVDILQLIIKACYNNGVDELGDIISSYKTLASDDQIRNDLMDFCANGVGGGKDEYKNNIFKDMVDINGFLIDVRFISIIKPTEYYDGAKTKMVYAIVINPDITEKLFHPNTVVPCGSRDGRDKILEDLRENLRKYTNIRIL